jgi:hypothetical protein
VQLSVPDISGAAVPCTLSLYAPFVFNRFVTEDPIEGKKKKNKKKKKQKDSRQSYCKTPAFFLRAAHLVDAPRTYGCCPSQVPEPYIHTYIYTHTHTHTIE